MILFVAIIYYFMGSNYYYILMLINLIKPDILFAYSSGVSYFGLFVPFLILN